MECIVPLVSAELRGMKINKDKLIEITKELKNQKDNLVFQLNDFIISRGYEPINFRSSKQLLSLFNKLELVITDRDGKPSANKDYIKQAIYTYPEYKAFLELLIQLSEMNKLISTYGDGILKKLDTNNIISTYYTINFTNTGRISSKADKLRINTTNLQNIPARSTQGQLILESLKQEKVMY
ncbi:MAG: hypothetical protein HC917_24935 [Richelia sp. SM2_1_7]|nr:hypothetical protein [Richelia sp. SM2_1_7]